MAEANKSLKRPMILTVSKAAVRSRATTMVLSQGSGLLNIELVV